MEKRFAETMEDSRIFLTYSLAMTMLGKSAQILAERGALPKAMSFITTGIELLAKQLRDYADQKDAAEAAADGAAAEAEAEFLLLAKENGIGLDPNAPFDIPTS